MSSSQPDGFCTCYPEHMGRTRDCGIKAHRDAALTTSQPDEGARRVCACWRSDCPECGPRRRGGLLAALAHQPSPDHQGGAQGDQS